jgi:arginyl-tRNA--protein-N-Asp/Glu arginylyltransferase|tara:strand:+ start:2528 stop:2695 length:168 start_codon:yes stop_codon:yes gene_type:complete
MACYVTVFVFVEKRLTVVQQRLCQNGFKRSKLLKIKLKMLCAWQVLIFDNVGLQR